MGKIICGEAARELGEVKPTTKASIGKVVSKKNLGY